MILWYYDIMILWYYDIMILWYYDIMILWYYDIMILWYYDIMAAWYYDIMISWYYDSMILWQHDIMTAWYYDRGKIACLHECIHGHPTSWSCSMLYDAVISHMRFWVHHNYTMRMGMFGNGIPFMTTEGNIYRNIKILKVEMGRE